MKPADSNERADALLRRAWLMLPPSKSKLRNDIEEYLRAQEVEG